MKNNLSNEPDFKSDLKMLFQNQQAIKESIDDLQAKIDQSKTTKEYILSKIKSLCDDNRGIRSIGVLAGKNVRERTFYINLYTDSDEMKNFVLFLFEFFIENDQIFNSLKTVFNPYFHDRKLTTERLIHILKKKFDIKQVDKTVFEISNACYVVTSEKLTHLKLSNNNIDVIPEIVFLCDRLMVLDLSNNHIKELPSEICKLSSLKRLNMDNNRLTLLSDALLQLKRLTELSIANNRLERLPVNIGKLEQLEKLYLNNNQLEFLPASINCLKNLIDLSFNHNNLESFPTKLSGLASIASIEADNNHMKALPDSFYSLSTLTNLSLKSNHIDNVSDTINQLCELENIDLRYNNISVLPNTICELGKLKKLYLSKNKLSSLPQNINQLKQLEDLSFTDNHIRTLPTSLKELNQLEILQVDNNPINNVPPEILFAGKEEIFRHLATIEKKFPHENIRHSIERLQQDKYKKYISYQEFTDLCKPYEEDVMDVSKNLHANGIIIHFIEDTDLHNTVFVKPEWVDRAKSSILQSTDIITNQGTFFRSDLETIWNDISPDEYPKLLKLMFNLGVCFQRDSDTWIVPQLMRKPSPRYDIERFNELPNIFQIEYHYQIMPDDVISNLIVRINHYLQSYWQQGMMIHYKINNNVLQAMILCEKRPDKTLVIKIQRNSQHYTKLLKIIQNELGIIHKQLQVDASVRAYIPCCCSLCTKDQLKFMYYYQKILEIQEKHVDHVICGYSLQEVLIAQLL